MAGSRKSPALLGQNHHPQPDRSRGCPGGASVPGSRRHLPAPPPAGRQPGSAPLLTGPPLPACRSPALASGHAQGGSGGRVGWERTRTCGPSLFSQESHRVPRVTLSKTMWRHKRTETGKTTLPFFFSIILTIPGYRSPFNGECGSM